MDVDQQTTLASVNVQDLTNDRLVVTGTNGELEDDANLAYNGSTLTVSNNTASTNSANGALVVTGGVGIGGALNVNGNTEIAGDLIVTGTTTTIEVQTLAIQDPLIHLADSNESGDEVDIGFIGHYYDAALGGRQHTGFFRDATDDKYYLFAQYLDSALDSSPRSNVIDRSDPSFVLADFNAATIFADTFSGTVVSVDSITTTNFTATSVDINGGFIDGTAIGHTTPDSGTFTNLTSDNLTVDTNTLYVDATNNRVGIGTTSPSFKIDVAGASRIMGDVHMYGQVRNYSGDFALRNASIDNDILFDVRPSNVNTNAMFIDGATTNVGIGTTSPSEKLHVAGNITTDSNIILPDNSKILLGDASDLQIYHDGTNSRIADFGTGELRLQGTNLRLWSASGENYLTALENGAVSLYYDNSAKIATTNTGVNVTGSITADSGTFTNLARTSPSGVTAGAYGSVTEIPVITLDASGFVDSIGQVAISTTLNTAAETGTGTVNLLDSSLEIAAGEGINTAATGRTITISGEDASTSNKGIASFASGDFDVSSGAVSIKDDGVGNAQLEFDSVTVTAGSGILGGGSVALGNSVEVKLDSGAVKGLFSGGNNIDYNNSTGEISASVSGVVAGTYGAFNRMPIITVDSYGQVDSIGLTVIEVGLADTVDSISFDSNTGQFSLTTDITKHFTIITLDPYTTNDLAEGDSNKYYTKIRVDSDIDQAFNENPSFGGTGAPFSVANDTKITNLNADKLDGYSFADFMVLSLPAIKSKGEVRFNDDVLLTFGQSNDLRIYHDQNTSYINEIGTGDLKILTNGQSIILEDSTNDKVSGQFTPSGSVDLYHNGSKKFETTNTGVDVTGNVVADGGTIDGQLFVNYSSTSSPAFLITSTDGNSQASPELELYKNSTSSNGHYLGQLKFTGENSTGGKVNYAKITGKILDNTNGSEDGIIEIAFQKAGSNNIAARFRSDRLDLINGTALNVNGDIYTDSDLSANNITRRNTTVIAGVYGSVTAIPVLTVDASGFVDSVGTTALSTVLSTSAEAGTGSVNLLDSSLEIAAGVGIDTVASGNTVTVEIDSADLAAYFSKAIVHDNTNGFVEDEHVAHSGVSITAGNGLTGGGDITSTKTLTVGQGTGITVGTDNISTNDAQINHDNLSGFVSNEHIDHSDININAGKGLTGGGDITSSRTIDIDSANVRAMFSDGDGLTYNSGTGEFAVGDGTGIKVNTNDINIDSSELATYYSKVINHDSTSGFLVDEHIGHSSVEIAAGAGLTGGGDITSTRTLTVGEGTGITVTADAIATNDAEIVHDNLSGFVANEHIDHSNVEITAGNGLTGGGTIADDRTLDVGEGTGITVTADAISTNDAEIVHDNLSGFVSNEHINHSGVSITAGKGLTGGGDITTSRTIDIDSANVRAMFSGGTGITYDNGTGAFTTTDGDIVHDNLSGFDANEHIDHSSVIITAGNGLTGGGTIASSRRLDVAGGDGITANADAIEVTVDGSTIELSATDGSGAVRVKDGGITNTKLENSSLTVGNTNIALGTTSTALTGLTQVDVTGQVNVDNVRIDGNTISSTAGSYMYIDPHPVDSAGTLVILGNLSVEGTTTTIKSTTVSINDKNIVLADSASDATEANGAGITVGTYASNPTITYDGNTDRWDFNKPIEVSTVHGALSGNATTATTATNVTATPNNSTNETVYLTFVDGVTGTQGIETDTGLTYNPSTNTLQIDGNQVLTTADEGSGNGLDADTLDGQHATAFQTVAAPNSPSITSTTVVNETIELVFGQSSTSGVTRYEVWSDGATGSDYSLISIIPAQDAAASMSVVDVSFDTGGTVAYRVYAIKNGVYSTAATTTKSFTIPSLDVTNMSVVSSITNYDIQYDLPETRFLDHIEIYKDAETTLVALSRTGAALIYSGSSDNFTYNVPPSDKAKFHQFWVEVVSV